MKFVVITFGTEGDTRPMAQLCKALDDAGHSAYLLAARATLDYAAGMNVAASALTGDIRSIISSDSAIARKGGGFGEAAKAFARIAADNSEPWLRAAMDAARDADAIILGGLAAFVGLSAAEALGIPAVGTGLIPITPTRAFPSPFLRSAIVPPFVNHATHALINALIWRAFKEPINAARATVCRLPPRQSLWRDHPMLYGISPALLPRPADWPPNAKICGQWLAPLADWTPSDALAAFLAAGDPPIYLGFGSMAALGGTLLLEEALAALHGRRVVFYPGWSEVAEEDLPENVHVLDEAPHGWLFPRTAVVIHHGGAGTAHAAARAGVPSVVVPFAGDQFFWADRLRQAGIAPAPVPAKSLTRRKLAEAISIAQKPRMRERSAALAASMMHEEGLSVAVAEILALAQATPRARTAP